MSAKKKVSSPPGRPGSAQRARTPAPVPDVLKAILCVLDPDGDAEGRLQAFAESFGYPVAPLAATSPEVVALLTSEALAGVGAGSFGELPADILDRSLLHEEWHCFTNATPAELVVFQLKKQAGAWHPYGHVLRLSPDGR